MFAMRLEWRMANTQEELLNGALARLLKDRGLDAEAEQQHIDVLVNVGGLRVAIEAKNGHRSRRAAMRAADGRIAAGRAERAVALCYPDGATEASLAGDELLWAVREDVKARADWQRGDADALADAVRAVPQAAGDADSAARVLSRALDAAVDRMSEETRQALAGRLGIRHRDSRKAAKRGMLVVATSMLFHHRLQAWLPAGRPAGQDGQWPPPSPRTCAEGDATAHRAAWRAILAVDYRPVFETAIAALDALPVDAGTTAMLRRLADSVSGIAAETVGLRHDLLGRIFHRVLDTARQDGSFYTSTAAATLLAALAIRETDADWSDENAIARLRICDPACGTGTLLMAAYERIYRLKQRAGDMDEDSEALLAQLMVEDVLWGYDINLTATHMTASTLGMMSPRTQFDRLNVHRARLGVFEDGPSIGSLELLGGHMRLESRPTIGQVDAPDEEAQDPPPMDLVIMNPPFTRDSLRHDQFTDGDNKSAELAIKAREKAVLANQPYRGAARLHSSGGMFAVMGTQMLAESGTLALVLPVIAATSPGNADLRKFVAEHLHIDTIVTSHDPQRIFFSENTSIAEMLLVCRRNGEGDTRVVNLARNPATPADALRLLGQLDGGEIEGKIQHVPAGRIRAGDWYAVNFLSPALTAAFRELREWTVPLAPVGVADAPSFGANIGPAGQRIRDSYRRGDWPTEKARRALWHHKTDVTQSMRAQTDSYIEPISGKEHLADRYWEQRGYMLLPHKLRLNLARAAAVVLDEPALGSLWTPLRADSRETEMALCAYLNSSIGVLAMLAERDARVPDYPSFSLDALRALRVPDFRERAEARDALAGACARLRDATLAPFPQMAGDPVRRELDAAVVSALSLDPEWVALVRNELAREPSVTGKRYAQ